MRHLLYLFYSVTILLFSAFTLVKINWQVNEKKYNISFSTDDAEGVIKGFKGKIEFDENQPEKALFDISLDVTTINTGNGLKNKHLKSAKWMNSEKYPTIQFVSTDVLKSPKNFVARGKLKIKETTKEIEIPFTFKGKGKTGIFSGSFSVNRQDYGITEEGIGNIIKIKIELPVNKKT